MPYCPNCGELLRESARFCSSCGTRLDSQKESGERRRIQDIKRKCAYCHGSGGVGGPLGNATPTRCPVCRGRGYNLIPEDWLKCRACGASGEESYGGGITKVRRPCSECGGTGWVGD